MTLKPVCEICMGKNVIPSCEICCCFECKFTDCRDCERYDPENRGEIIDNKGTV
jgi:hypothetical protein